MSFHDKLKNAWSRQGSMVCVGLDPDNSRLPQHLPERDRYFEFCRAIVDATAQHCCAFKPQAAHFAAVGREHELAELLGYIRENYPHHVTILDAKRGDVGSTAAFYAQEAFVRYDADAVTLNPYLGYEAIAPYLEFPNRGLIVLCRTSNPDSNWLQSVEAGGQALFLKVASRVAEWDTEGSFMLVAGATYPEELGEIRDAVGDLPLLVPGIGAQSGDLAAVLRHGLDSNRRGMLISSSRAIIYAGEGESYADAAGAAAQALNSEINTALEKRFN